MAELPALVRRVYGIDGSVLTLAAPWALMERLLQDDVGSGSSRVASSCASRAAGARIPWISFAALCRSLVWASRQQRGAPR
jgi:hypothetical protein